MFGEKPTFFRPDQGPLSQHGKLAGLAGFQSRPLHPAVWVHIVLQASRFAAGIPLPASTLVCSSTVHRASVQSTITRTRYTRWIFMRVMMVFVACAAVATDKFVLYSIQLVYVVHEVKSIFNHDVFSLTTELRFHTSYSKLATDHYN